MELSATKTKEAKKYGVKNEDLVFADLLSLGYQESDAYIISHPDELGARVQTIKARREAKLAEQKFKNMCEDRRKVNAAILEFSGDISNVELIDNEQTAREILKIARQMPENSKERGEMFMKYADLTRKNDAKTEEVTEAINFYLPLKCHQCPLLFSYNKWIEQKKKDDPSYKMQELRPVEMEAIIRKAAPYIRKAKEKGGE